MKYLRQSIDTNTVCRMKRVKDYLAICVTICVKHFFLSLRLCFLSIYTDRSTQLFPQRSLFSLVTHCKKVWHGVTLNLWSHLCQSHPRSELCKFVVSWRHFSYLNWAHRSTCAKFEKLSGRHIVCCINLNLFCKVLLVLGFYTSF